MKLEPRLDSLDTFKFFAVFGVICLHGRLFFNVSLPVGLVLDQVLITAVPFFFLVSGYLFQKKIMAGDDPTRRYLKMMKRLGLVFAAWNLIYLWETRNHKWMLVPLKKRLRGLPGDLIELGVQNHFESGKKPESGCLVQHLRICRDEQPSRRFAGWVIVAGLVIQLGEWLLLHTFFGWENRRAGYILGTVVYGTGFLLLALALPSAGNRTGLSRLGKYALGIYASHLIFLPVAQKYYHSVPQPLGEAGVLAILAASLLFTFFVMRLPYMRRIVT